MRRIVVLLICTAAFLCGTRSAFATAPDTTAVRPYRPVVGAYTVGLGSAHICNTYLTPLRYAGFGASLRYERLQAMAANPERLVMQLDGHLDYARAFNPAHNAAMTGIDLRIGWAAMWRHRLPSLPALQLYAGGYTDASVGGLLLARNGNNPAQARGAWTIGATGMAVFTHRVGRLPVTWRYQARMPLAGMFFSPDYGELYYEIYLGNHKGLLHGAWPGNYFRINNLLTADLHLGNTCLRLGYACDVLSTKTSGIVTRDVRHQFVVGVTTQFITIGRARDLDARARVISAIY